MTVYTLFPAIPSEPVHLDIDSDLLFSALEREAVLSEIEALRAVAEKLRHERKPKR